MKNIDYDAAVIQSFADKLYSQARLVLISSTLMGVLIGAFLGGVLIVAIAKTSGENQTVAVLVIAAIGGVLGFMKGMERSLKLKLDAQIALCQVQIEKNTRKP